MKSLRQAIDRLGPTGATVLILGESGVGKERAATALHKASGREAFVAVNCAAIPKELMEAELFGAEKGAYTGALKTRAGLVEEAAGGTLFLDEIGEMESRLQPKLLRFLETRLIRRVGGNSELPVEVRVISATNSNLETEVAEGKFRADLYYRLSEVTLRIPPLRSRREDIPQFTLGFLQTSSERFGKHFESVEPELVRKLQEYEWPGNVRELKNAIDRMVVLYDGPVLRTAWWDPPRKPVIQSLSEAGGITNRPNVPNMLPDPMVPRMGTHRKHRLEMARRLLDESGDDLTWVAAQLGIHPTTLYRWRKANKI
jgi:transcriptional regulator with PAS, ATPase and Fis domain